MIASSILSAAPLRDEEKEVRAAVQLLLDGWREADVRKVEVALHPQARLVTLRKNPDEMQIDTPEHLLGVVRQIKPGDWDDRLLDVQVQVDSTGLGIVWARYEFFSDGTRSHCGRVLFQLYRLAGRWRIVNFADTHSEANCPAK